jgi:hypothetical protein
MDLPEICKTQIKLYLVIYCQNFGSNYMETYTYPFDNQAPSYLLKMPKVMLVNVAVQKSHNIFLK